jgi:4-azaleucine resistance transporter AzlC
MKTILPIIKITLPVFFGYIAIGMPFGIMLVSAGYPFWLVPLMSIFIYAGAGQYMAVGLFAAGAGLFEIVTAQLLLNSRHIFYGLPLLNSLKNTGKLKAYIIFALTDETYALLTTCKPPENISPKKFYTLISLFDHLYWILGSILGGIVAEVLPISFNGIDFALSALFAVLLIEQIKKTKTLTPIIIGISVTIVSIIFIPAQHIMLASIAFGLVALSVFRGFGKQEKENA